MKSLNSLGLHYSTVNSLFRNLLVANDLYKKQRRLLFKYKIESLDNLFYKMLLLKFKFNKNIFGV